MDLRGMPLAVVEAAVRALHEHEATRKFLAVYPGTDSDLLSDLAPSVAAAVEAWSYYQSLVAECVNGSGHELQVITDETGPLGVICGHCGTSWVVQPAPAVPQPDPSETDEPGGPDDAGEPGVSDAPEPAPTLPDTAVLLRPVASLRPASTPELAEDTAAPGPPCAVCANPVDAADAQLTKANSAMSESGEHRVCRSCLLTCEVCGGVIPTVDAAVLTFMRWRKRMDAGCVKAQKGA